MYKNQMGSLNWSNELEESTFLYGSMGRIDQVTTPIIQQIQNTAPDNLVSNFISRWNTARSGGAAINAAGIMHSSDSFEVNIPPTFNNSPEMGLILDSGNSYGLESNSQMDTKSVEDDGISMIFSDIWNFTKSVPLASNHGTGMNSQSKSPSHAEDDDDDDHGPNANKRKRQESQHLGPSGLLMEQNLDFALQSNHSTPPKEPKSKKSKSGKRPISSPNINFTSSSSPAGEPDSEAIAQMKEMIYRAAAFRPVNFGAETVDKPKRKNVKISSDPQTVAARQRRERISEKIRVLQRLVPGGTKLDTATMLDEAANYLKFLRSQVKALEALGQKIDIMNNLPSNASFSFSPFVNNNFAMQQPQFIIQNPNPVHESKN